MNKNVQNKIDELFRAHPRHEVKKNTILTLAGEDPKYITYLIDGVVEQYHITPQGNKVVVNVYKPPAFFPMSWAINGTPNTYFYETLTEATLVRANPNETVSFLKDNADVTFDLLSRVYRGSEALLRRIILASSGIAVNRIVFELLVEAFRFGEEIDDHHRSITIKQNILAARSGLARETVSRELRKLADGNYIEFTKQGFILAIEDLEELLDLSI